MISTKQFGFALVALSLFLIFGVSKAPAANTPEQTKAEIERAVKAANAAKKRGPADIPFAGQATFHLPKDYGFIPLAESKAMMEAVGNPIEEGFIGFIVPPEDAKSEWAIAATYIKSGYVKDDDAKDWKADELLNNIRSGSEETNKSRKERGIPEMDILGWVEKPAYDAASHRLVWSIASRDKGQPDTAEQSINHNTLVLGREGYISMQLMADRNNIGELMPVAQSLLGALEFNAGKSYADFNAGTDKVAAYGLAAIVAGVAAKKLGLFAVLIAFVAKFVKVIVIAVIAGFGGFLKKFRRNKSDETTTLAATTNTPPSEL